MIKKKKKIKKKGIAFSKMKGKYPLGALQMRCQVHNLSFACLTGNIQHISFQLKNCRSRKKLKHTGQSCIICIVIDKSPFWLLSVA
jgi:hypothetical protein